MGYQSRIRHYRSPRERNRDFARRMQRILLFLAIGVLCWAFMNRVSLIDWLKTYFY